jgi:protocatechuate 3,4-dioxygenase beta subunit
MKRRDFIRTSALTATAVTAFGFIRFDGEKYVGDCATTSDILGPFYRPGSPERSNLVSSGSKGRKVDLIGKILHQDCITPYKNAKVELWHCDADGVYDNSTEAFRYRGTVHSDNDGNYAFQTIIPVPYDAGGGLIRPAHFHLMVTAEGYQPLVTQLYFSGDKNISKDPWASAAKDRYLEVQDNPSGVSKVVFNVGMAKALAIETASIDKLTGNYIHENDPKKTITLFNNRNSLWVKNEVFGEGFEYAGNNLFVYPSNPEGSFEKLEFEISPSGAIKLTHSFNYVDLGNRIDVYIKQG